MAAHEVTGAAVEGKVKEIRPGLQWRGEQDQGGCLVTVGQQRARNWHVEMDWRAARRGRRAEDESRSRAVRSDRGQEADRLGGQRCEPSLDGGALVEGCDPGQDDGAAGSPGAGTS
jgi:hypothetical protein